MKSYSNYSSEDFACDDEFVRWVKNPERDPGLSAFWQQWLLEHPEKAADLEEAKSIILAVATEVVHHPASGTRELLWSRIEASTGVARERVFPAQTWWYAAAAALVAGIGVTWFLLAVEKPVVKLAGAFQRDSTFVKQINNSESPKTIILSDGTSIVLQPGTILEYPATFSDELREVRITGQAFFEVSRDAARPFLVHSGEIVTRVLGTSFIVRNFETEENVLVQVKTGKVSVFRANEDAIPFLNKDNSVAGVVLMPNQQVLYGRREMTMTKSLVESPSVLTPSAEEQFEFADAPIRDVFFTIEKAYGVEIVFDEEAFSSCYLNASLGDLALYEKLKLICKGIDATYELMDSHIIVYGKGCHEENQTTNPNNNSDNETHNE